MKVVMDVPGFKGWERDLSKGRSYRSAGPPSLLPKPAPFMPSITECWVGGDGGMVPSNRVEGGKSNFRFFSRG